MSGSTDIFGARILIVDDQECNVRLLSLALRRGGYVAVSVTTNPLEVCALHHENQYDLILLDLQMPHLNGFEVLEGLMKETAVLVLVVSADPTQMAKAMAAGATGFLSKPFALAEVLGRVHLMLSRGLLEPASPHVSSAQVLFDSSPGRVVEQRQAQIRRHDLGE